MKNKNRFRKILLLILTFLLAAGGVYAFKTIKGSFEAQNLMPKDGMPYLFQYDKEWKDFMYGEGTMEETGCGPTSLAMALSWLSGDSYSPKDIAAYAKDYGYYVDGAGTSWDLFTEYPMLAGISAYQVYNWMDIKNNPNPNCVYIFSMGPGDFTSAGHIIAAKDVTEDGFINVHDPNSKDKSHSWKLEDLFSQANAIFCLEK